ncbi:MAG: regulatory protein RecX [Bacteroidales bacterium]|nr:regulatory protein RecX [Bacteroidales bacterium]
MDKNQALNRAMALCSRQEYCEANIRAKLEFWGIAPEDIDPVIEQLIREKFIDVLRYATAYVRDKVRINHWGRIKIRYMLSIEKLKHSIVDQAIEEIDEELYTDVLKDILTKKALSLKNEADPYSKRQKLVKYAQSRGFEIELIIIQIKDIN